MSIKLLKIFKQSDAISGIGEKFVHLSKFRVMKSILRNIISLIIILVSAVSSAAQVNTDQVMRVGQNALYFEDYLLSIQYFNQAIEAKPYMATPYFYRSIAKLNLADYVGAEADATKALELNPYLSDAWEVRGVARQNLGYNRRAIDDYTEALKLLPRNRHLLFNKALALTDLKEYDAASDVFAELIKYYPGYENSYLGRAHISLERKDTVSALADIDKALQINDKAVNGYIMRAGIAIDSDGDYESALADIDKAIKLLPRNAGLYINRAYLRYRLDSYNGAMSDYDYALTIDPLNYVALFNRGLLLMEVSANDLALEDFNRVLELEPDEYRALYNRAVLHRAKGNYKEAAADITRVAEHYPDFPGAFYLRGAIYRDEGQLAKAEADFKKADRLSKSLTPEIAAKYEREIAASKPDADTDMAVDGQGANKNGNKRADDKPGQPDKSEVSRRFARLLTVDNNVDFREEYNNSAIRGRVQDRNTAVETEPMMMLSFYSSPSELRRNTYYIREVDDLNATRMLRFALVVTNAVPAINEDDAARHFNSIDYYNSYLATHTGRPVDYIGRALDFLTVRDYVNAERDADRASSIAPDLALAYMIRAQARYSRYLLDKAEGGSRRQPSSGTRQGVGPDMPGTDAMARLAAVQKSLSEILSDYDKLIELSPRMAIAYFNKGCILLEMENYDAASKAFAQAIELKPDFGEAYYNRGYIELRSGHRDAGIADLSKAGELGIARAYNLIKRMAF